MQKIETITPAVIKQLRQDLEAVVSPVLNELGLTGQFTNASYTNKDFTIKLVVKAPGISDALIQLARLHDWPAIGTTFHFRDKDFTVCDYAPKKSAPIICEADGKRYVFTAADVKRLGGK